MSNVNSSFEPETILLREALRRVVLRRGEIGEQVVKRWEGKSDHKLTTEDCHILNADAKTILYVLRSGKLKAMYSPGKNMLLKKVKISIWNSCKMDNIHWRLSAIREKQHDPMFEDIEVNAADFERAISQREDDIGACVAKIGHSIPLLEDKNAGISSLNKQIIRKKSRSQILVQEITKQLSNENTHIDRNTEPKVAIKLIQSRAGEMKKQNNAIIIPSSDVIRRAIYGKK